MKILEFLNGKKTAIAAIYWGFITPTLPIWFPDGVPSVINNIYLTIGIALTVWGVGHKIAKGKNGSK